MFIKNSYNLTMKTLFIKFLTVEECQYFIDWANELLNFPKKNTQTYCDIPEPTIEEDSTYYNIPIMYYLQDRIVEANDNSFNILDKINEMNLTEDIFDDTITENT